MNRTNIEYLDFSWNPLAMRCTPCSPGCEHCWHLRMADRLAMNYHSIKEDIERVAYSGLRSPVLTSRLTDPLKIRKPSRIGVQFMGDLFHESVSNQQIEAIFKIMDDCRQHTFFILTKRPKEMAGFFDFNQSIHIPMGWPHVWLGVTVCNQQETDEKIPILLQIPGFKKWVSYEPALGPIDLQYAAFNGADSLQSMEGISWIVAGSESGPGARPADNSWFRSIRDQCHMAGVPFFMKQTTTGEIPDDLMIKDFPPQPLQNMQQMVEN